MRKSDARTKQSHRPGREDAERRIGADDDDVGRIASRAPQRERPRGDQPKGADGAPDRRTGFESRLPDAMDPDSPPALAARILDRFVAPGSIRSPHLNVPT